MVIICCVAIMVGGCVASSKLHVNYVHHFIHVVLVVKCCDIYFHEFVLQQFSRTDEVYMYICVAKQRLAL